MRNRRVEGAAAEQERTKMLVRFRELRIQRQRARVLIQGVGFAMRCREYLGEIEVQMRIARRVRHRPSKMHERLASPSQREQRAGEVILVRRRCGPELERTLQR